VKEKRILHGQLMSEHRRLTNEISDIKAQSFELNEEQIKRVQMLEMQVKKIAEQFDTPFMKVSNSFYEI
jgi:hypothetical protein